MLIASLEASKGELEELLFVAERDLDEKINDFQDFRLSVLDQAKNAVIDNQLDVSVEKGKNLKASFSRARTSMKEKRSNPNFVSAERFKELEDL